MNLKQAMATALIQIQPDVYPFAAFLGEHFGCTHMIAIGERTVEGLAQFHTQFEIVGIVPKESLETYRNRYEFGTWVEGSFERPCRISVDEDILRSAIIVCTDAIERLASPAYLWRRLKGWLDYARVCIVTCAERDAAREGFGRECSARSEHEWSMKELECLLHSEGFNLEFIGLTASDTAAYEKKTALEEDFSGAESQMEA